MNEEILKIIKEQGILLEKEVFDILNGFKDGKSAQAFLESIIRFSGQKIITKSVLTKNAEYVQNFVSRLGVSEKGELEKIFIGLGITISLKKGDAYDDGEPTQKETANFQIFCADTKNEKKLEVGDFVGNFRARYHQLQKILMQRAELNNLMSINKISGDRQNLSVIGILTEKRVTKNKNLILVFEDLTGKISALVKADKKEIFSKANEIQLDDVVAVKASGSRDILFVQDILFPEAFIVEKTKFNEDISIAFISDIHCGSTRHLGQSFQRFLDWLNSTDDSAKKIKYLFIVGDTVDGVGIFPGQEEYLNLKSMKEQYLLLASYLKQVPKRITIFMCPGQHDAVRVAEPQPIIGKTYASCLYEIENLILVTNPTMVKLKEQSKEFKVLMYHGASISDFIHEIPELREIKANLCPAKVVGHMLKRRHLSPTHSLNVYIPNQNKDPLVIEEVPDVLCTGEMHRLDIETHNGVLAIVGSCWQAQTPFEEKVGNIPDPAKVPVLNLKTRELKIFDFGVEEEIKREY